MVIYMCDRRKNKGFTLAELLIVIAIMGILCAFGFVAVVQHQRNLKLTEADNIAREIYEGAQNHLTAAEASGAWQNKYASYSGSTEEDTNNKKSYYGDVFDQTKDKTYTVSSSEPHDFRTITINASNAQTELTGTALETMLPIGSIDETVRSGGTYVIEYDAATAQVYGVFYTEDQKFGTDDVAKIDRENGRTDRDYRKLYQDDNKKYAVGYYGGADAEKASASDKTAAELQTPEVEIINGSRLYLKVTYTDNFDALNKLANNGSYSVQENINIYDSNGNKNEYVINQAVSEVNSTGKAVSTFKSGNKVSQYFILDSIVDGTNYHFSNQFPELTGRNITAQVTLTFAQNTKYEQTKTGKCKKTHNSLYADGTDVNIKGAGTTVTRAKVSNARHLENLSYEMNSAKQNDNEARKELTVNKAVILNDIDWKDFFNNINVENGKYNLIVTKITEKGSHTVYLATGNYSKEKTYFGIVSSTLTDVRSATGIVKLSNFSISPSAAIITDSNAQSTAMSSQEVSNNAGLFSALTNSNTITVRNLTLKNFTLTGCETGSSINGYRMGTLFGAVYSNNYSIDNITVSNFDIKEYGTHAGGLIGLVDATPTVNLKNIQIKAGTIEYPSDNSKFTDDSARNFQQCGGMIGTVNSDDSSTKYTNITINNSSVSDVILQANCLQSGGVIGAANKTSHVTMNSVTVDNLKAGRYSSSSGTQQFSGGFIGIVNGEDGNDQNKDHAVVSINSSEISDSELSAGFRSTGEDFLTKQGGIIGCASGYSDITVSETKVTNTVIAGKGAENGGMIGEVSSSPTVSISSSYVQYSGDKSYFIGNEIGSNNHAENTAGGMIALITGAKSVTIENSYVYSVNSGISSYSGSAGGVIGQLDSGSVTLSNSYASVGFISDSRHVYNDATAGINYGVGGIAGKVSGDLNVSNSYVAGRTNDGKYAESGNFNKNVFAAGGDAAGGFIGFVTGTATVSNSYTTASVYANAGVNSGDTNITLGVADSAAGGFIGKNTGRVTLTGGTDGVVYCTGLVTADDGINKGAFIGAQSGTATYTNCYALSGINDTSLKLIGDNENEIDGLQYGIKNKEDDTKSSEAFKSNNTLATPCDKSLKSQYAYRGIGGISHVGDWPIPEETKEDAMLVYYEKIHKSDGSIVWRYHGYSEKFANGKKGTGDFSIDETNYNAKEISSNGDGSNPFVNESGNYVIEDGYALLIKSSNSMGLNASNILIGHQQEAADLNKLTSNKKIIAYNNLQTGLGISGDYSAYVLKDPTLIWNNWSSQDGGFYVFKKSSDSDVYNNSVRIAQFFINPYFANDISTVSVDKNTSGEIRSSRQLSQLFGMENNNKFLENVSANGFTVNQTMDIDFKIDCTEAGKKAEYSSKQYTGNNFNCVYNGLSDSDQKHIIKGITTPFAKNMCKIFENVNIVDANTTSLFETLQSNAIITNVDVTNGTFSKNVVVSGTNNGGEISNVTLNGVTVNPQSDTTTASTTVNGICDDNQGVINNIKLINCVINAGNGIATTNNKTIKTVEIYNTEFNTATGAGDGNGIVRKNSGIISDVKIGKDSTQSGTEHEFTNGNGIAGTNTYNGTIDNISIESYTFDTGNGIAQLNVGIIGQINKKYDINVTSCEMKAGNAIVGSNGREINNVYINHVNAVNGAVTYNGGTFTVDNNQNNYSGSLNNISINDVDLSKYGLAETNTSGSLINKCNISNAYIGKNGAAAVNKGTIASSSIVNAKIGGTGFVLQNSGNLVDDHIYSYRAVLGNDRQYFKLDGKDGAADFGGVYDVNAPQNYNLYNMTTIGYQPKTSNILDSTNYSIGGFVNTNTGNIYGCSVTATIASEQETAGFVVTSNGGTIEGNYANVVIRASTKSDEWVWKSKHSGYSNKEYVSGFVSKVSSTNLQYNYTTGVLLADTNDAAVSVISGFARELIGYNGTSQYNYSAIWCMNGDTDYRGVNQNYAFCASCENPNNLSHCGWLATASTKNYINNYKGRVKAYSAAGLATEMTSQTDGFGAVSENHPYYTFINDVANQDENNPYPMPHKYTYSNGNITKTASVQPSYGDWYIAGETETLTNSLYENTDYKIKLDTTVDTTILDKEVINLYCNNEPTYYWNGTGQENLYLYDETGTGGKWVVQFTFNGTMSGGPWGCSNCTYDSQTGIYTITGDNVSTNGWFLTNIGFNFSLSDGQDGSVSIVAAYLDD